VLFAHARDQPGQEGTCAPGSRHGGERAGRRLTRWTWWSGVGGVLSGWCCAGGEAVVLGRRSVIASSLLELTLRWDERTGLLREGSHSPNATLAPAAPKNFDMTP
jgi:hypothetical protein